MKLRILVSLIAILAITTQSTFALLFPDTEYSWYRDSIMTLAGEGVISGFSGGIFGGDKTITRAEILKVFLNTK